MGFFSDKIKEDRNRVQQTQRTVTNETQSTSGGGFFVQKMREQKQPQKSQETTQVTKPAPKVEEQPAHINSPVFKDYKPQAKETISQAQPDERKKETGFIKVVRFLLPDKLEKKFGVDETQVQKPTPNIQQTLQQNESARQAYVRQKQAQEVIAKKVTPEQMQLPKDYKEPGFFGQLADSLKQTTFSVISGLGGNLESIGIKTGSPDLITFGQQLADDWRAKVLQHPKWNPPEKMGASTKVARLAGAVVPSIGGGIVAAVAGGIVAGPPGAAVTGGSFIFSLEHGMAYNQMIDDGVAPDQASTVAGVYGAVATGLESINFIRIGAKVFKGSTLKPIIEGAKKSALKEATKDFLKTAAIESSTEAAQQFAQNVAERFVNDNQKLMDGVIDSALGGAIGGGVFGGIELGINTFSPKANEKIIDIPNAQVTVVPKGDGQYFAHVNVDLGGKGFTNVDSKIYTDKESAADAGVQMAQDFAKQTRSTLDPNSELEQIRAADAVISELSKPIIPKKFSSDVEQKSFEHLRENYQALKEEYRSKNNNVISADDAKDLFVKTGYNKINSKEVHEPASVLSKAVYKDLLQERKGKGNNVVLFTAGGSGVGKTTAVKNLTGEENAIVYDTNLQGTRSSSKKIQMALDAGYDVRIAYVYRDPVDAWVNGVMKRTLQGKRHVPVDVHVELHQQSLKTLIAIADTFGSQVDITARRNQTGKGASDVSLAFLRKMRYDEDAIIQRIYEATRKIQQQQGKSEAWLQEILGASIYRRFESGRAEGLSRGTESKTQAVIFASPNIAENTTYADALVALRSDRQAAFRSLTEDVDRKLALDVRATNAIGDWSDGAEGTVVTEITGDVTTEVVTYAAALHGKFGNQKAVIPFVFGEGENFLYETTINSTNLPEVRKALDKYKLPYRTIVPVKGGLTRIMVFDMNGSLQDNFKTFSQSYGAIPSYQKGTGTFLGGDTRSEGLKAYQQIIKEHEARPNVQRVEQPTQGQRESGDRGSVVEQPVRLSERRVETGTTMKRSVDERIAELEKICDI